jgi:tRNA-binding EMAP/Myf-like protein
MFLDSRREGKNMHDGGVSSDMISKADFMLISLVIGKIKDSAM